MDTVKMGNTEHDATVQPSYGLRWRSDTPTTWVASARGRNYFIEQRMPGVDAEFVAYDASWPGRALTCATFFDAILAAQSLSDGFDGDPTQADLEQAASVAVAALAYQLVGDGQFHFHTLGRVKDGKIALFHTQLETGVPNPPPPPPVRKARVLSIVPQND